MNDEAIYTHEQHEQLVGAAVENAKETATADSDAEILRLNEQVKQAEETATKAEAQVSELEKSNSDRDETERLATLADERAELVKAAVNFSDEQVETRKASWAAKTEEEFDALIEDYKAAAATASTKKSSDEAKPPKSKLDSTRETAGDQTGPEALQEFFGTSLAPAVQ